MLREMIGESISGLKVKQVVVFKQIYDFKKKKFRKIFSL